jgi:hypothetical protein
MIKPTYLNECVSELYLRVKELANNDRFSLKEQTALDGIKKILSDIDLGKIILSEYNIIRLEERIYNFIERHDKQIQKNSYNGLISKELMNELIALSLDLKSTIVEQKDSLNTIIQDYVIVTKNYIAENEDQLMDLMSLNDSFLDELWYMRTRKGKKLLKLLSGLFNTLLTESVNRIITNKDSNINDNKEE